MTKIIANSLDVDEEFIKEIKREIKAEGRVLNIKYDFEAKHIKSLKKSLVFLYDNIKLIVLTIKDFSPKS